MLLFGVNLNTRRLTQILIYELLQHITNIHGSLFYNRTEYDNQKYTQCHTTQSLQSYILFTAVCEKKILQVGGWTSVQDQTYLQNLH